MISERIQPDPQAGERLDAYVAARGWKGGSSEGEHVQVRPLPHGGDFAAFWRLGGARVAKLGLRGGFVHPVTGRTLGDAVLNAMLLTRQRDFSAGALHDLFEAEAKAGLEEARIAAGRDRRLRRARSRSTGATCSPRSTASAPARSPGSTPTISAGSTGCGCRGRSRRAERRASSWKASLNQFLLGAFPCGGTQGSYLSRLFDIGEAKTAFGRALLVERYRALQRQVPLLYTIAFVNFLGLVFASGAESFSALASGQLPDPPDRGAARPLEAHPRPGLPPERILAELRRTLVLAGLLSVGFGYASIELFFDTEGYVQQLVVLFASLAAVGCAYGLTSFPAAARLPLLLFALPFSATLAVSSTPAHVGVGISLALLILLILRLVKVHNDSFVQLVWSRSEVENERERAQRAEREALAEKARVRIVADTDPLTGLANRRAFIAELGARLEPTSTPAFGLALLDLDGFKPINDTFGHAAGDAVLVEVAARLAREAAPARWRPVWAATNSGCSSPIATRPAWPAPGICSAGRSPPLSC